MKYMFLVNKCTFSLFQQEYTLFVGINSYVNFQTKIPVCIFNIFSYFVQHIRHFEIRFSLCVQVSFRFYYFVRYFCILFQERKCKMYVMNLNRLL